MKPAREPQPSGQGSKNLGNPDCDVPIGQDPFSTGVVRQAKAWLSIRSSGTPFNFDPKKTGSCKKTSSHKPANGGFTLFDIPFVERPSDGQCAQLYLHSFDGKSPSGGKDSGSLGVMDLETLRIKREGPINFNGGELTGIGDGTVTR